MFCQHDMCTERPRIPHELQMATGLRADMTDFVIVSDVNLKSAEGDLGTQYCPALSDLVSAQSLSLHDK